MQGNMEQDYETKPTVSEWLEWEVRGKKLLSLMTLKDRHKSWGDCKESIWRQYQECFCDMASIAIDFIKSISEFRSLRIEDQIVSIKHNVMGVFELISANTYEPSTNSVSFLFMSWEEGKRLASYFPNTDAMFTEKLRLGREISKLRLNVVELAILAALCMVIDQSANYTDPAAVAEFRELMAEKLLLYEEKCSTTPLQRHLSIMGVLEEQRMVVMSLNAILKHVYGSNPQLAGLTQSLFQEMNVLPEHK